MVLLDKGSSEQGTSFFFPLKFDSAVINTEL